MVVSFLPIALKIGQMKKFILALMLASWVTPLHAQLRGSERTSLFDTDPDVVYLEQTFTQPIRLKVAKKAAVFSDNMGDYRLGWLKAEQTVILEAMTDKTYRVRGQGTHNGIAGWVAPWAFSSADPDFVANLKILYDRQIQVQRLISDKQIAIGMTLDEVILSQGKPTKTSVRKTAEGQAGKWEFIEYEDVKNYANEINPSTGQIFRRLVSITRVEKSRTSVEFENNFVTATEESEDHQGGNVKIIVPPLVFRW